MNIRDYYEHHESRMDLLSDRRGLNRACDAKFGVHAIPSGYGRLMELQAWAKEHDTKFGEYHAPMLCPNCKCRTLDEQGHCEKCDWSAK